MKKLSKRLSVKQSSTLAGQRELLREHTNAINELIDIINDMQGMKPYTAMRSTGECACKCHPTQYEEYGYSCQKCWGFHESKAHKPQEDVIEDIVIDLIIEAWDLGYKKDGKNMHLIQKYKDRILAIVKGE